MSRAELPLEVPGGGRSFPFPASGSSSAVAVQTQSCKGLAGLPMCTSVSSHRDASPAGVETASPACDLS